MSKTQHFGRIIRDRRENKRLTIREVAEMCDMSDRGLENIELGDSNPKLSNVLAIADALGLDLGDLNSCVV